MPPTTTPNAPAIRPSPPAATPAIEASTRPAASPAACYLARLTSPRSRTSMRGALQRILRLLPGDADLADMFAFPWHELRPEHTAALRAGLAETYKPATANQSLSALRGVLREAWRLGLMSHEDFARAADVQKVAGSTLPAGRHVTGGELRRVFDNCSEAASGSKAHRRPAGVRDAAIFACFRCGLRRAEVIGLNVADVRDDGLLVRGKGGKERRVPLDPGAEAAISAWIDLRTDGAHPGPGPLFVPMNKSGRLIPRRLTAQALHKLVMRRAAEAGIDDLTPHDFRRTYIGDLLDAGADVVTVAGLVGHANVATTQRYDRRPDRVKAQAACMISTPYRRA